MIKRLLAGPMFRVGFALIAGFIVVAHFAPFLPLSLVMSCLSAALATAVVIAYGREAWEALLAGEPMRGQVLALGIAASWAAVDGTRMTGIAYRVTGDTVWLNTNFNTFLVGLSCMAAALHLTAPHDVQYVPRRRAWAALWIALGLGLFGGGVLLGLTWRASPS